MLGKEDAQFLVQGLPVEALVRITVLPEHEGCLQLQLLCGGHSEDKQRASGCGFSSAGPLPSM